MNEAQLKKFHDRLFDAIRQWLDREVETRVHRVVREVVYDDLRKEIHRAIRTCVTQHVGLEVAVHVREDV